MDGLNFEEIRSQYHDVFKYALNSNDAKVLEDKYKSFNASDRDLKSPLDQVFRDVLLDLLEEGNVEELQNYVTFCIETCRKGITTATMPVVLLGDIFEALTLNKCEEMFTFVENGVHIWKEELFFLSCKNNLLRMCNDLLRRLSRTQSTVFCGRILLFLAKFFPFSERSGLNIVSEFNLENITEYKTDSSASLRETVAEMDNVSEEKKSGIDFNLYCKFWALQDFFRNPNQCYNKVQWKIFASHASDVLSAFSSYKLEDIQRQHSKTDFDVIPSQDDNYFAKFLTNQKLLELQLSDSKFRRCILIQFLILFQYLTSAVKFKNENYELKPDQIEWVKKMTDVIHCLLVETPPDGDVFAEIIKNILKREEHWNAWKNDGCPEFKKPKPAEPVEERKKEVKPKKEKRLFGDIVKDAMRNNVISPELKYWNLCPDNLEACKAKERDFLPPLETYFSEAIEQLDASAMIEEEYKKVNDGNFGWRALRLLAKRSPHFFTHSNNPISKLPLYLEIMTRKIAKDIQDRGNSQPQEENQDAEMEELLKEDQGVLPADEDSQQKTDEKVIQITVTSSQLELICSKLGEGWKKLAAKLGFKPDEILFFESKHQSVEQKAMSMLQVWFEDDTDASVENLCYILEGLGLNEASDLIKNEFINS